MNNELKTKYYKIIIIKRNAYLTYNTNDLTISDIGVVSWYDKLDNKNIMIHISNCIIEIRK